MKQLELIARKKCAITGEPRLKELHTFKKFPVLMECTDERPDGDIFADMSWGICETSGVIQLKGLVPLDILYSARHDSSESTRWNRHHKTFAGLLSKYKPESVFEIGGSYGILSKFYNEIQEIDWTIIDINPEPIPGCKAKFIKKTFDSGFNTEILFDTVIHTNLLEHIYDPDEFIGQISKLLKDGQYHIFSHPNLKLMLENKYTNAINFEHTIFFTEPCVEYLLAKHGFRVMAKEYFLDDHSIFYATARDSSIKPPELSKICCHENIKIFNDYLNYYKNFIEVTNEKIKKNDRPIFLFGGHVFTQYLISFGLDVNGISCLLDNDKNKHGKRLYGTNLKVESPKILEGVSKPVVILKAGPYNEEIKADIIGRINSQVEFWE